MEKMLLLFFFGLLGISALFFSALFLGGNGKSLTSEKT